MSVHGPYFDTKLEEGVHHDHHHEDNRNEHCEVPNSIESHRVCCKCPESPNEHDSDRDTNKGSEH